MIDVIRQGVEDLGGYGTIRTKTIWVDGNRARVRLTMGGGINDSEIHRLRRVDGRWLLDGNVRS